MFCQRTNLSPAILLLTQVLGTSSGAIYCPGAVSRLRLQTPLVSCGARQPVVMVELQAGGGVSHDGDEKLKNSSMLSAAASRAVKGGRLKRVSINFRIEP